MQQRRPFALGAALAIALASLGVAMPAHALETTDAPPASVETTPTTDPSVPAPDDEPTDATSPDWEDTGDAPSIEAPSPEEAVDQEGAEDAVDETDADAAPDAPSPEEPPAAPVAPIQITSIPDDEFFESEDAPTAVSGTGEPGAEFVTEIEWVDEEVTETVDDQVADDGTWSVDFDESGDPLPAGMYVVSVSQTVGEETSGDMVIFVVFDSASGEDAPTLSGISEAGLYTGPLQSLAGTGIPGAELSVFIVHGVHGSEEPGASNELLTTVGADGNWAISLDAPVTRGWASMILFQEEAEGERAGYLTTYAFFFDPITFTSVADGQRFAADDAPSRVTGTLDAAFVADDVPALDFAVTLAGERTARALPSDDIDVSLAGDGTWSADFGDTLPAGEFTLTASLSFPDPELQNRNFLSPASTGFGVDAAPGTVAVADSQQQAPSQAQTLAQTGSDSLVPWILGAVVLVLIGVGALLLSRRKRPNDPDDPDDPGEPSP